MKLQTVKIKDFRRFSDLTVQGIPRTARLIILAGPNGCGKSSFFDALYTWHKWTSNKSRSWDSDYHVKAGSPQRDRWRNDVTLEFHDPIHGNSKKVLYARSAYRNDPEFQITELRRLQAPLDQVPFSRMIDNDAAVSRNYQRLACQVFDVFDVQPMMTDKFTESIIGPIRGPISRLFPDLKINDLVDPLQDGTFRFTKGTSEGFSFKNLSGGEKAAFDLILDLVVARRDYDNTLFCIDEPESHMNARLQAELLSVLYDLIPENCQLMLATHSIGMMRRAQDIETENPRSVVFLDFGDRDFDQAQIIEPTKPDRTFWKKAYDVALDDLAALVAPKRVVICEGEPRNRNNGQNYSHDARCYEQIFKDEFPETQFVPGGNAGEVTEDRRGIAYVLGILIQGTEVVRLIDRDAQSPEEIADLINNGIRILSKRNLESYLFSDEALEALAGSAGKSDKARELLDKKAEIVDAKADDAPDDLKPASGEIYVACKRILDLAAPGNNAKTFMRDTLAPLIKPGMAVYEEIKHDIFGSQLESCLVTRRTTNHSN